MGDRRLRRPLLPRQRRTLAVPVPAHHLPKLVEVMHSGGVLQTRLHFCGQIIVGGVHIGKVRAAKRMTQFVERDLYGVQHICECDHAII
jgi:hypothetical protein